MFWLISSIWPPLATKASTPARETGKPDGCATFLKVDTVPLRSVHTLYYADGSGTSQLPAGTSPWSRLSSMKAGKSASQTRT